MSKLKGGFGKIKASLKRKIGPLPVWAWALLTGVAIFAYRMRQGGISPASSSATTPDDTGTSDPAAQLDPITLEPGQSAYNPNTGQLVSAAPEQVAPGDPVTLDPGQAVYDPGTGDLTIQPSPATKTPAKKKTTKRKPKAKPHHKAHKAAPKPGHHKSKPRATGRILKPGRLVGKLVATKGKGHGHVPTTGKARVRGTATAHPSGSARTRAAVTPHVAIRQRPAAHHATHPGTQKVGPHPARAQVHHDAPAAHPQRARKHKRK